MENITESGSGVKHPHGKEGRVNNVHFLGLNSVKNRIGAKTSSSGQNNHRICLIAKT